MLDLLEEKERKMKYYKLKLLKPKFIILDELDSGLDVDSLKIVCNILIIFKENPNTSVLIITHYPRILEYIKPDYVHMMVMEKLLKLVIYNLALNIEKWI